MSNPTTGDISPEHTAKTANVDWLDICKGMLHDFDDLVANSDGISGLHHNGDIATWDDLTEGSNFLWTGQFTRAREAIAAELHGGTTTPTES